MAPSPPASQRPVTRRPEVTPKSSGSSTLRPTPSTTSNGGDQLHSTPMRLPRHLGIDLGLGAEPRSPRSTTTMRVFVFFGSSPATGSSEVIADVLAGTNQTHTKI